MAKLVTEIYGGEPYEYYPMGEYVVRAVGVCGGEPTFKYTRIDVAFVMSRLSNGASIDELVEDYEGRISREAILEALSIAAKLFRRTRPPKKKS
jgi:uncharacterized protein (DUF433 family)